MHSIATVQYSCMEHSSNDPKEDYDNFLEIKLKVQSILVQMYIGFGAFIHHVPGTIVVYCIP